MKLDVIKLDAGKAGSIELNDEIFGLAPRGDILQRLMPGTYWKIMKRGIERAMK